MWSENEEVFIDIDYIIIHCRGRRIHCSFWGEFAKTIEKYFAANDNSLPIILMFFIKQLILQFGKTRKYMGRYSQLHITIHVWTILFRYFFFLSVNTLHTRPHCNGWGELILWDESDFKRRSAWSWNVQKKKYGVVTYKYMIFAHFYAWPWLTTLRILFVDKMDSADVQLTQGVSMISSYIVHIPW